MSVATEGLHGYVRSHTADGLDDGAQSCARPTTAYRIVASDDKEIDGLLVIDSLFEPRLLNHVSGFDDLRNVAVASEVEKNAEGHDVETLQPLVNSPLHMMKHTLISLEVSVLGTNVLKCARGRVYDLNIASKVLVSIDLGEVAESLVRDLGDIELMIANGQ
jgi:hypothetical protein